MTISSADDLKKTREERGLTQSKLASMLNVTERTIIRWEQDGIPAKEQTRVTAILNDFSDIEAPISRETGLKLSHVMRYLETCSSEEREMVRRYAERLG